ncbi:MAG TPA: hypothetical protein VIY28_00270 [Pseudonocardiaceae bacterium]
MLGDLLEDLDCLRQASLPASQLAQAHGHPGGTPLIALRPIQAVRAFAGVEHQVGLVAPLGGPAQTFKRLGVLGLRGRRFEAGSGLLPRAAG